MRKNFFSGLVILLPLIVTYFILKWVINLITGPFEDFVLYLFTLYNVHTPNDFLIHIIAKTTILVSLSFFLIVFGCITRLFFIKHIVSFVDRILLLFPFVNRVYRATKEFTHAIFSPKTTSFSQVVLVPYPSKHDLAVGFITGELATNSFPQSAETVVSVLIPGTPNPTVGFALFYKKKELVFVDVSPKDALKFVISCGSSAPKAFLSQSIEN